VVRITPAHEEPPPEAVKDLRWEGEAPAEPHAEPAGPVCSPGSRGAAPRWRASRHNRGRLVRVQERIVAPLHAPAKQTDYPVGRRPVILDVTRF